MKIFEAEEEQMSESDACISYKKGGFTLSKWDLPDWLMVPQSSPARFCWDLMGFSLMLFELFWLPMQFFDPAESMFVIIATWATRLFWTVDVPLNLITGYVLPDGSIEHNFIAIVKNYARSWLCLDIAVIIMDWAEWLVDGVGGGQAARAAKALKLVRGLRMMRLMRLMKMPQM
mmetsp:Transcript_115038/g.210654  ORF Transcript_115038/g.210654 Transcript_115038/m.210654 type:complete len:174 (+) Transcript_115038:189-710(+)